jgi:hypothetical protein
MNIKILKAAIAGLVLSVSGCSAAEGMVDVDSDDPNNWPTRQVNLTSGEACVFTNDTLQCVENPLDMICLDIQYGSTAGKVFPSNDVTQNYTINVQDRFDYSLRYHR